MNLGVPIITDLDDMKEEIPSGMHIKRVMKNGMPTESGHHLSGYTALSFLKVIAGLSLLKFFA